MKTLLLPTLLLLLSGASAFQFVDKVDELPLDVVDIHAENARPKVRRCGDADSSSESSVDCVLCTVCRPHEYELIGCTGKIDSVCSDCSSGWMRITPKTPDFFLKCNSRAQIPLLFPDYIYPQSDAASEAAGSMFAAQEKVLMNAELRLVAHLDRVEEESEEEDDEDYEEGDDGWQPVEVDERDEDAEVMEQEEDPESTVEDEEDLQKQIQDAVVAQMNGDEENDEDDESDEIDDDEPEELENIELDNASEETNNIETEEVADPFEDEKNKKEIVDSPSYDHPMFPLHRAAIWNVMDIEDAKIDDGDIEEEAQQEILDRKEKWLEIRRLEKLSVLREKIDSPRVEIIDVYELPKKNHLAGGYRPLRILEETGQDTTITRTPILHDTRIVLATLFCVCIVLFFLTVCYHGVRVVYMLTHRELNVPEMDELSEKLINEACARIHAKNAKKAKGVRPEFV